MRLNIEDIASSQANDVIVNLIDRLRTQPDDCDLVIDLGAPNFQPLEGFSKLVTKLLRNLPALPEWRTFTLLGTSFPKSMAEISLGSSVVQRSEWLLYKAVNEMLTSSDLRLPSFGDYTISHPELLNIDMRLLRPSANIRYTIDDGWFIVKGPNVRDNGFNQFRGLCEEIVSSPHYMGRAFSKADEYISECAQGRASTGNLSTWRWIGTNHHMQKVIADFADFANLDVA